MSSFEDFLSTRLCNKLPGQEAQIKMRPYPSVYDNPSFEYFSPNVKNVRNSSVLAPIQTWNNKLELILTLRTAGIKHGGQISFPGGGQEGNESYEETALRETHEEIGLPSNQVNVIGKLSPLYIDHSNNMVTPVVGFIHDERAFTPNPNEVEEVFTVPLSDLLDVNNQIVEEWDLRGYKMKVPFWNIHRVPLWGATAMIISELIELYKEYIS